MGDPTDEIDPTALFCEARSGSFDAMSQLVQHYRPYLAMLARLGASRRLQQKYDESDLVQETLLVVQRDLRMFKGSSEAQLLAWLRAIMATVRAKHVRHHTRQRRNVSLERQIEVEFDQSSQAMERIVMTHDMSPSEKTIKRERAVILSQALAMLPADYREALIIHRLEGQTLVQTADRMGRSLDSVQKLLARGLLELRRRLEGRL